MQKHVIFLFNLLQDVSVNRPLAYLAASDLDVKIGFVVSESFIRRDALGNWMTEIRQIAADVGAEILISEHPQSIYAWLSDKTGTLVAASESTLVAHQWTHDVFRITPPGFLRVTLQHGYECVGFVHNKEHDLAHGTNVAFAADIVCGWAPSHRLRSMMPSERSKLFVTGPSSVLQLPQRKDASSAEVATSAPALICENMHSVRFSLDSGRRTSFLEQFGAFAGVEAVRGIGVALRPHPGGQYVVKSGAILPSNVAIENRPIFHTDLTRFAYGVSAPSTILLDMMLANLPVAIWRDPEGAIDIGGYAGLRVIDSFESWLAFDADARHCATKLLDAQRAFLDRSEMPIDPTDVRARFAQVLSGFSATRRIEAAQRERSLRLLVIGSASDAEIVQRWTDHLGELHDAGTLQIASISSAALALHFVHPEGAVARKWLDTELESFRPDLVIIDGYHGSLLDGLAGAASNLGARIVRYLGAQELEHGAGALPDLGTCHLVLCESRAVLDAIVGAGCTTPAIAGAGAFADILQTPIARPASKIGWVGEDRESLASIVPALVTVLRRDPFLSVDLLTSIERLPGELEEFAHRIAILKPGIGGVAANAVSRDWDIALCPRRASDALLPETEWVELTAAGIAVVADADGHLTIACANGCGLLARGEAQWIAAIETLAGDTPQRMGMVSRAQDKLRRHHGREARARQAAAMLAIATGKDSPLLSSQGPAAELSIRNMSGDRLAALEGDLDLPGIVLLANGDLPTLRIFFTQPLAEAVAKGEIRLKLLSEAELNTRFPQKGDAAEHWITDQIRQFRPTVVASCRYSGPFVSEIVEAAKEVGVKWLFQIDDDLLNVPIEFGERKYRLHNDPARLAAIRFQLKHADLVYCSTEKLLDRLRDEMGSTPAVAGDISSGMTLRALPPEHRPPIIGYMGGPDHKADVATIVPAIALILARYPDTSFEIMGLEVPEALQSFGQRVRTIPSVAGHENFQRSFSQVGWTIGLAPLRDAPFNHGKSDTKWVEYSAIGAAVVASRGIVYDACCDDGCGLLATTTDEWVEAISQLLEDDSLRLNMARRAQAKLQADYSPERMRQQVGRIINRAAGADIVSAD